MSDSGRGAGITEFLHVIRISPLLSLYCAYIMSRLPPVYSSPIASNVFLAVWVAELGF
jgi:hypothetical protein